MATNPLQISCDDADAGRCWRTVLAQSAPVDQRTQARKLNAELRVLSRIWQRRVAAGSFGNSWYLLRSTK